MKFEVLYVIFTNKIQKAYTCMRPSFLKIILG